MFKAARLVGHEFTKHIQDFKDEFDARETDPNAVYDMECQYEVEIERVGIKTQGELLLAEMEKVKAAVTDLDSPKTEHCIECATKAAAEFSAEIANFGLLLAP